MNHRISTNQNQIMFKTKIDKTVDNKSSDTD